MRSQQVTITLPETIYEQVKRQSQQMQRSVADELVAVVTASLPEQQTLPLDIQQELSELDLFTDEELWQAARVTVPEDKTERMQTGEEQGNKWVTLSLLSSRQNQSTEKQPTITICQFFSTMAMPSSRWIQII